MVQPAIRSVQSSDSKPVSLAERLDKEFPIGARLGAEKSATSKIGASSLAASKLGGARPEPTVSSMAERFAPGSFRYGKIAPVPPLAADAPLAGSPPETSFFSTPTRGVVAVLMAVAIAPAGILAGLLWFGAIRGPDAGTADAVSQADASPAASIQQAAVAPSIPLMPEPPEIAITAPEEILAEAGEAIAFSIAIDTAEALPARAVIAIRDLPDGASFSQGRPFGAGEWTLAPDEITDLTLRLPQDQTGASDLRVELVAADGAVLARTATRLDVAPPPTAGLVVRSGEADRIDDLMAHGQKMIDVGYFAGARAYYQRAAEAGSGEAALAVGATYDPEFVSALAAQGIKPDPEAAETWYSRAAALGIADREAGLAALKKAWTGGGSHAVEAEIAPPEEATPAPLKPSAGNETEQPGPLGRLVAAATELAAGEEWVEVSSPVNVRKGPSSNEETFKVAQKGTKLRVVDREGNWVHIADPATEQKGWIYTRFLKETEAP